MGVNEWSQAKLMKLLNPGYENEDAGGNLYWNRRNGFCYTENFTSKTPCIFSSTGLSNNAKNMIDTITWNLGSNSTADNDSLTPEERYNAERGNSSGKACNNYDYTNCDDNVARTLSWQGKVALMYPSDYGYATSNRSCLTKVMNSVEDWNFSCSSNDWLGGSGFLQFTLTPFAGSMYATSIFVLDAVYDDDHFAFVHGNFYMVVSYPTLYLTTNVKVASGNGSSVSPYVLSV